MVWMIKKLRETDDKIIVGYNEGSDEVFDGIISYDKVTRENEIILLSAGDCEAGAKWCGQHARSKITDGLLGDEPLMIAIG